MTFAAILIQAQDQPPASTILQSIMVGLLIIFVFSVGSTLFITKKLDGLSDATSGKALGATMLKNVLFWPTFLVAATLEGMPILGAFAAAGVIVPMVVYKFVYGCTWRAALVVWLVVFAVEAVVGYGLIQAGMTSDRPAENMWIFENPADARLEPATP